MLTASMPAEGVHLTALREAVASPSLCDDARRAVTRFEDAARLGAILPDLAYFDRYAEEVARYALRATPRPSRWGSEIHDGAAISIVVSLARQAQRTRSLELAALALGAASHAALDRLLHPLVNALARRFAGGRSHDAAHREVEKFHSICFHERYFGQDRMGTEGIVRLTQVPFRDLFARPRVRHALVAAFASALPKPPTEQQLWSLGRGYEWHVRVLGSPLGKLLASDAEKAMARPKFLVGAWGRFDQVLERACQLSLPVLEAVWRVSSSDDRQLEGALDALELVLPMGSIDTPGDDVDLDRPWQPATS